MIFPSIYSQDMDFGAFTSTSDKKRMEDIVTVAAEYSYFDDEVFSKYTTSSNSYFYVESQLKNKIRFMTDLFLSSNIMTNANELFERLSLSSQIDLLDSDIYLSKTNTILIDVCSNDNEMTIEIGKDGIGYFSYHNDDLDLYEELLHMDTEKDRKVSISTLDKDIRNFIEKNRSELAVNS